MGHVAGDGEGWGGGCNSDIQTDRYGRLKNTVLYRVNSVSVVAIDFDSSLALRYFVDTQSKTPQASL